jgi:hypothetical protein
MKDRATIILLGATGVINLAGWAFGRGDPWQLGAGVLFALLGLGLILRALAKPAPEKPE